MSSQSARDLERWVATWRDAGPALDGLSRTELEQLVTATAPRQRRLPLARCVPPTYIPSMDLPPDIREQFRRHGRAGGKARAARMAPDTRRAAARRAASARWIRARFGASDFTSLGLPGGELIDAGLADLAAGVTSAESLLVSLASTRLRREGVPMTSVEPDPDMRLYELLAATEGDLAHARYNALRSEVVSFANACRSARVDR